MIGDDVARLREYVEEAVQRGEERLPPEPKLGEALGVTRGRLRTMLKHLEDEGLIWRHVGKGTFVGARQIAVDDKDAGTFISVDDIINARLLLEPQLAAQAAIHATPADIATIDRCLDEMAVPASFAHWKRLDEKLHRTIAEATHNGLVLMMYDVLRSWMKLSLDARVEEVYRDAPAPKQTTDREHRLIADAIRSHNPAKAEEAMREHLRSVRVHLFGLR